MKIIISENQMKNLINEGNRFLDLKNAVSTMTKIIDNYGKINCDDSNKKEYVRVYCKEFQGADKETLIKVKESIESEMYSMMADEFSKIKIFN